MPLQNPGEPNFDKQVFQSIPRPQKIAVIVLALAAILIIIFWILQFRSQLTRPLGLDTQKTTPTEITTVDPRTADTDKDGLTDYEEINIYKTSPYLEDTDSDGTMDKQEIADGTDPTCPKGKNCGAATEIPISSSSPTTMPLQENFIPDITLSTSTLDMGVDQTALQGILSGGADIATIRQILIQSGIDKNELDKISDADLMKSYQETLQNQNKQ